MFDMDIFQLSDREGQYILAGQLGSKAYGTDTPESDDDLIGVAVAPMSCYTGLDSWENDGTLKIEKKVSHNAEMTAFELKKFLRLCLAFNPNAVPALHLRPVDYTLLTNGGRKLIEHRDAFNSARAYKTMLGYAQSQRSAVINGDTGRLGTKRKLLVAKFGYDVKFASHTIRLLRMADEFFRDGVLKTYRSEDREELLAIRNGWLTLEEWIVMVDDLFVKVRKAQRESNLPEKPNVELVNHLCMSLIQHYA